MSTKRKSLKKYIYLSICAAVATIALKSGAYFLTDSVGLLSDALESCVNLVAACIALYLISLSERPADERHAFGHSKAEYFSSAVEGFLIIIAAASIAWTAIPRIIQPEPLENVSIGLFISVGASVINLLVARILINNGKKNKSIVLEADGKHLMTDVWTSVGVICGIALVKISGWNVLDGVIALLVAANIIWSGFQLMKKSTRGLMDSAISKEDYALIEKKLDEYGNSFGIDFHSLLSRQAGQRAFISFHVLVPSDWTVKQGHDLVENIERDIRGIFDGSATVFTHLEPKDDPASMEDIGIYR